MKKKNHVMTATFWGVRGSIPTPGREFIKYGGNTSCVELRCGDTILVFDAGTGMRGLGRSLMKEFHGKNLELHVLFSHTHWDHIQGFPFLEPAYLKGNVINLYGGHSVSDLEKLILGQMDREYFPVTLMELASDVKFHQLSDNPFSINDVKIYYTYLFHPGLSLGFRVEYRDRVFVYATDNEILIEPEMEGYNERNMENLIRNADILVAECQYTEAEYLKKIGWGHSSIDQVVRISRMFGVKNLFTFHHDPMRTDREIDRMIKHASRIARKKLRVYAGRESTSFSV
ncbi:MAG: MBL fold metallo-hydrolase [Spirochaetes bacterium]|nr:MBL fold metallo-hydrolase [Spirochaetota bacterium]